jgi:hypothetical protein
MQKLSGLPVVANRRAKIASCCERDMSAGLLGNSRKGSKPFSAKATGRTLYINQSIMKHPHEQLVLLILMLLLMLLSVQDLAHIHIYLAHIPSVSIMPNKFHMLQYLICS